MSIIEPGRRHSTALLWAKARPSLHIDFSELVNWSVNYQDGLHLHIFCQMDYSSSSHKGVRSMEVRGAQLLHSLDGTKHHPFVTPGIRLFPPGRLDCDPFAPSRPLIGGRSLVVLIRYCERLAR